jgi:hypothetical protein
MLLPIGLVVASVFQASDVQGEVPREVLLLARIKQRVERFAAQLPDYTCLETIERSARSSTARPFKRVDTVRLEVGQVGNKEVFSWPGAERFEERNAFGLVAVGTVSTGEFAQLLRAVFIGGFARIVWRGEEDLNGRRALRYDFSLPLFGHRWQVNLSGRIGDVAARGSFWADADSLELLRLESHAADIPADLPLAEMVSRIDYGRMRIHTTDVWLPQTAELLVVEASGEQRLNRIEFSHCRQYTSNSIVSFASVEPRPGERAPQGAVAKFEVPAGLLLTMELATEIDSQKASVGDLITARLAADATRKGSVVVPKGAVVRGRIRRLERSMDGAPHFVVGLEFSDLEFGYRQARFFGRLESTQQIAGLSSILFASTGKSTQYGSVGGVQGFAAHMSRTEKLFPQEIPGVGTFFMTGDRFRLPAGMRMVWRTVALTDRNR